MASAWIERRAAADGRPRWRVRYRPGGREVQHVQGGSYGSMREARIRRDYIAGDLAAGRVPDLALQVPAPAPVLTLAAACEAWRASRIDVAESTRTLHRVALARFLPALGERDVMSLTAVNVAASIAALAGDGLARNSLRHSLGALRGVLDHAGVEPNPARDRGVRLPHEPGEEVNPPTAAHVERALSAVAPRYRLPLIVLEATAMRIGELEGLRWKDVERAGGAVAGPQGDRENAEIAVGPGAPGAIRPRPGASPARGPRPGGGGIRGRRASPAPYRPGARLQGDRRSPVRAP